MRTLFVYLLALGAVAVAVALGFPELFRSDAAEPETGGEGASAPPPVVVAVASRVPFGDTLEALGTILANESVEITSNRSDHVTSIHFADGQDVAEDDLLVAMNSEEEEALLAEASAIRDDRRLAYDRVHELYERGVSSERELDNAKALLAAAEARVISLGAAIADRQVRAPFAGTLGLRRISVGAYVQPATVITTLDDLSVVKLDFTIPEMWVASVTPGMTITARSDAFGDDVFHGDVLMVDTRLDERTRSATVRATLPNPERRLRPGMLAKVVVERGEGPVLQIPEEAVIPIGDEHFVLRLDDGDVAHRVPVDVGRRQVGVVEVTEGLEEGDRIVVEGILRVRPEAAVQVVATRRPRS